MESPMLSTPLSRNSSSSIHLNSSGVVTAPAAASLSRILHLRIKPSMLYIT
uniref:Uncharacterized protein n=1 Tax=Leersia perrieri TaxID=77586 RepID=A0A0D9XE52_9ORYZ